MSGDLVSGRFPLTYPFAKSVALASNVAQGNINVRSSLEIPFLGSLQDAAASLVSGKVTLVAVPVEIGDEIQAVDVLAGATAASEPEHSWAALYSGAGVLLGSQSTDGETAAIAASKRFSFTLGSKYIIQPADAPNGFVFAAVSVTAKGKVPSLVSGTVPTACQYAWYTNMSAFVAGTSGSALEGKAPASVTLSGVSAIASPPAVFLR